MTNKDLLKYALVGLYHLQEITFKEDVLTAMEHDIQVVQKKLDAISDDESLIVDILE